MVTFDSTAMANTTNSEFGEDNVEGQIQKILSYHYNQHKQCHKNITKVL
jgi:hypothetical protein